MLLINFTSVKLFKNGGKRGTFKKKSKDLGYEDVKTNFCRLYVAYMS